MKTIFYIDDDLNSLYLIKEQIKLIDSNVNVITESRGISAIKTFKNKKDKIDLIILDVHIPEITGYDLLLLFKKMKPNIPIIMVTASNIIDNYDHVIKKLGASNFYIKPITKDILTNIITLY